MAGADTFPKLLDENARVRPDRAAIREKALGIWQVYSWQDVRREVEAIACGLAALGVKRGDKIAVVGDNRPHLYWTIVASQALGAVPVPIYQDAPGPEMLFVLDHAETRFAVVEDQEQVDKLLEVKGKSQFLQEIVFCDQRGMRNYAQPFLRSMEKLAAMGRDFSAANPGFYAKSAAAGQGGDAAIMLYTSGTTGQPKGVVLSFDNLIITARNSIAFEGLTESEEILAYLPMAWVGDNIFSIAQSYLTGFCVNCPESSATVMQDLREIGPTFFFAPPRIYETILTNVMIRMEDASRIKRRLFKKYMALAKRVGPQLLDGRPVSFWDRLKYWIGNILVYGPLKNTLGFTRVKLGYTAGEAIGPDIFDFFRSLGMNLKQLYGQTEASVFLTIQPNGEVRSDTVGKAVPMVELKIDDSGEVLYRSPGVFREYFKNAEATAATKTADGWVKTGDAGFIDKDGHLHIIDRAKDVGRLKTGSLFAPKYIENKLKFFPSIREAVTFGHERDFVTALISIDMDAVGNWAEKHGLAYSSYQELASKDQIYDLIQENIEQVNRDLANDPQLAGSQIKRFVLLHKELDADDGELTRTRKVRRGFVAERYGNVIDALYSGAKRVIVEAQVKFEDGRTGTIKADLKIGDAKADALATLPARQAA